MDIENNPTLVWDNTDKHINQKSAAVISSLAPTIIERVYDVLLNNPDTALYLDHEIVKNRLKGTLKEWLQNTFTDSALNGNLANKDYQKLIGEVHARIGIPLDLLNASAWLIKSLITECLIDSDIDEPEKIKSITASHNLIDQAMNIMDNAYFEDLVAVARHQESLRVNLSGQQLANDCERAKSSLFEWIRRALVSSYDPESDLSNTTELPSESECGLWIKHKATIFFCDDHDVKKLYQFLEKLDSIWNEIILLTKNKSKITTQVKNLNDNATRLSQLLSEFSSKSVAADSARDTLTRFLNRRNMPHIMQRETMLCIKNERRYSVLLLDIDHFKKINDEHGHPEGDLVLSYFAEVLRQVVRTSDFIFRYGGEEFLVLLVDTNQRAAKVISDKIRKVIENEIFELNNKTILNITCSIGISTFDGQPDYQPIITAADNALLEAKRSGRNRVVFHEPN